MRKITANIQVEKGRLNRFFSNCIGAGRAGEVMRYSAMKQLEKIQRECPFKYIRFHGLFHEEMNIVNRDENGNLIFCFQYIDILFDSLLDCGIRPVVELGLMPQTMAEEECYVFWWKMNISSPKKIDEWYELVEALVKHVTERYGEEEIKKWYFEVWNEPNHSSFFSKSTEIDEYFKLYDSAACAVKKINAEYRVGGPVTAGMAWITDFIRHCRDNKVPLDFISSHSYGVKGDFDADGKAILKLCSVDSLADCVRFFGDICKKEGLPLLITEWSSSYSSRDPIHDTYFNASYILNTVKRCDGYADMLSYWTYTDIFEESSPPCKPFHGGFGLINVQSIPKPSFYAYTFLNRLGNTELKCNDEQAYICTSKEGIQLLFWNIVQPTQNIDNRTYFLQPLPSKSIEDVEIEISGLESNRKYTICVETIGYRSGDVYNAYIEENFTDLTTQEETNKLIELSKPKKVFYEFVSDGLGVLKFYLPQTENQVDFVTIS